MYVPRTLHPTSRSLSLTRSATTRSKRRPISSQQISTPCGLTLPTGRCSPTRCFVCVHKYENISPAPPLHLSTVDTRAAGSLPSSGYSTFQHTCLSLQRTGDSVDIIWRVPSPPMVLVFFPAVPSSNVCASNPADPKTDPSGGLSSLAKRKGGALRRRRRRRQTKLSGSARPRQ